MRAVEEEALVALVLAERRRSNVPLGDGAYAMLAAPGGPLALAPLHEILAAALTTVRHLLSRDPRWVAADAATGLHLGPAGLKVALVVHLQVLWT